MARKVNPLTATAVKNAKATGKQYNLADGGGLMLRVSNTGSKRWLLNYAKPYTKKRTNLGLGGYPEVSLADARERAAEAKRLLANGIDPVENKAEELLAKCQSKLSTLEAIGEEWLKVKRTQVSEQQADKIWRRLELHVLPALGKRPITELTRQEVIKVLRPIEAAGTLETVKRLCQALNQLMTYAANAGYVGANNLTGINKAFETPKPRNMPSLTPERLPELMAKLHGGSLATQTRLMIELQLHTMTRPNEVAEARWEEVDLEGALWVIPAERMKMKRAHKIPLSDQALNAFNDMQAISGHREYVFPKRGDPLGHASTQTANQALKRIGFHGELVSHGLRSLASTTLNEQGFEPDIIESALAHMDGNEVRAAYNRAEYLQRRRLMMDWWGKHIERAKRGEFELTNQAALRVVT
ncbi:integrase domain-containing protein [Ferrimonas marina]|uniref:Integrase n=1 Tax=Ferrimonas marina TaxID=299255 RepID=A0A1M5X803_9GAMM|nr:integrase domain-containing protein [Ferrimonas marina]SHH95967.1 Integrase [Ferrimonas marina]